MNDGSALSSGPPTQRVRPARLADGLGLESAPVTGGDLRPGGRLSATPLGPPLPGRAPEIRLQWEKMVARLDGRWKGVNGGIVRTSPGDRRSAAPFHAGNAGPKPAGTKGRPGP